MTTEEEYLYQYKSLDQYIVGFAELKKYLTECSKYLNLSVNI